MNFSDVMVEFSMILAFGTLGNLLVGTLLRVAFPWSSLKRSLQGKI